MTAILCAALVPGIPTAATAAAEDEGDRLLGAVEAAAPGTLRASAATDAVTASPEDESVWHSESGASVVVATEAIGGVTVNALDRELQVGLPFADEASDAVAVDSSAVAFDNGNGSTTLPVVHEDGSVQIFTIIDSADAPTRYDYDVSTPDGGTLTELENGAILVTAADGAFVGVIAPPWAKDASGTEVPTRYVIEGNKITQVVEHAEGTQYPVVADPWLGVTLFSYVSRTTYSGDYRYNGFPTVGGALILSGGGGIGQLAGQAVFRDSGWAEWKAAYPAVTNKATLQQQYDCHVLAGYYGLPFTGEWNIERVRVNKPAWLSGIVTHRCNWNS